MYLEKIMIKQAEKKINRIRKGSFKIKVPKSVDIEIIDCICGKNSQSWALLHKDGTFETTCPNCVREYYEGTYSVKPYGNKIEFDNIPYNFNNKKEDELSVIPYNGLKCEGEVKFRVLNDNSNGYLGIKHIPVDEDTLFRDSL